MLYLSVLSIQLALTYRIVWARPRCASACAKSWSSVSPSSPSSTSFTRTIWTAPKCKKISACWAQSNWVTNLSELSMCKAKTLAVDLGRLSNLQEILLRETEDFAKVIAFSNASQVLRSAARVGQYLQTQVHTVVPASLFVLASLNSIFFTLRISIYHCSQTASM